jgi:hypothetical protein
VVSSSQTRLGKTLGSSSRGFVYIARERSCVLRFGRFRLFLGLFAFFYKLKCAYHRQSLLRLVTEMWTLLPKIKERN